MLERTLLKASHERDFAVPLTDRLQRKDEERIPMKVIDKDAEREFVALVSQIKKPFTTVGDTLSTIDN